MRFSLSCCIVICKSAKKWYWMGMCISCVRLMIIKNGALWLLIVKDVTQIYNYAKDSWGAHQWQGTHEIIARHKFPVLGSPFDILAPLTAPHKQIHQRYLISNNVYATISNYKLENRIYAKNFDAKLKILWPTEQQSEVMCYQDKENFFTLIINGGKRHNKQAVIMQFMCLT